MEVELDSALQAIRDWQIKCQKLEGCLSQSSQDCKSLQGNFDATGARHQNVPTLCFHLLCLACLLPALLS